MILQQRTRDGKNAVLAWGSVWSEPFTRKSKNNTPVCNFYLRHDTTRTPNGKNWAETVSVESWARLASFCSNLKLRSWVVVMGTIDRDEYASNRQGKDIYKITAQMVIPVGEIIEFLSPMMEERAQGKFPNPDQFAQFEESNGHDSGSYNNYSQEELGTPLI